MVEKRDFQDIQRDFAAHIRDPAHNAAPPGIEDRRMAIYRNLFFNNLRSLLSTTYPVLRKLHDDEHWSQFIREFMRHHASKTPYFLELPAEFLSFLSDEYTLRDDDFPFLTELAHYEYIELALSIATTSDDGVDVYPDGDLVDGIPVKSELCWAYAYSYPVHRISRDFVPTEPAAQPVYLAVYRGSDDKVGFLELNAMNFFLLEAIAGNTEGRTGRELLADLASKSGFEDIDRFVTFGRDALTEMRTLGLLTGIRKRGT